MRLRGFLRALVCIVGINNLYAQAYNYLAMPDSLTNDSVRAEYLAEHFWDNADWNDDTLLAKPKVMLDYLYVLRLLPKGSASKSIGQTVQLFDQYPKQYPRLLFWLERYLHDPRSPYFSDEMFSWVVDAILQTDVEDEFLDVWLRTRETLGKNRIGQLAEDFTFIDKQGRVGRLYDIETPLLMLIFHKPNCSRCQKTEELISRNDTLQRLLETEKMKILGICIDSEYEEWMEHTYPENWLCGFDEKGLIEEDMLYEIRQYPSIYLLDKEKHILLKEADYELVQKALLGR